MRAIATHFRLLLVGLALIALPVLYELNEGISLSSLNPHDHVIQNGLTYWALLLFTYLNHTVFVPRWYLAKRYGRYVTVVLISLFTTAWLPHRIEQWTFLQSPADPTVAGWAGQLFWKENMPRPEFDAPPPDADRPPQPSGRPPGPPPDGWVPNGWVPNGRTPNGRTPDGRTPDGPPDNDPSSYRYLVTLPAKLAIIFLLGGISALASISVQTQNRLRQAETKQLLAELRQLKAQINPHFLFNTLNSIYALAIREDDRTADAIVKLAEFMRYVIRDAQQDRVSLQSELNYLHNYIDLQQARLRDAVILRVDIEGEATGQQIAPLILFTFIENAFKYGVNPDVPSTIHVRLTIEGPQLTLHVFNRKVPTNALDGSTAVGLHNAQERLQLLYPGRHQLRIDDADQTFTVDLTMYVA